MRAHGTLWRSLGTGLLIVGHLNACTRWKVQSATPEDLLSREHPKAIRIERKVDGEPPAKAGRFMHAHHSHIVLNQPRLVGDTIVGATPGASEQLGIPGQTTDSVAPVLVAVAVADVGEIAVRRRDPVRGVLLSILIAGALVGIFASGGSPGLN